jgi:Carboxypeptidase regulatory-like domain
MFRKGFSVRFNRARFPHLLVLTLLFAAFATAQTATGSLDGTVTDPNGAVVPGVTVTAKNDATGTELQTLSSDAGLFVFPALQVGHYSITAEKPGFKKTVRSDIEIRVAFRETLALRLEVGEVQQTIEVHAEAQLLETTNAERGQNVSQKLMESLPIFAGAFATRRRSLLICRASMPAGRPAFPALSDAPRKS